MTPGHDALPASSVGFDPSDPVRRNPPAASTLSGEAEMQENTPTLASATPATDVAAGGASVVLAGTHLKTVTAVEFGGVPATSFVINSDTQITAVAPAHAAGATTVRVKAGPFTSNTRTFTYT